MTSKCTNGLKWHMHVMQMVKFYLDLQVWQEGDNTTCNLLFIFEVWVLTEDNLSVKRYTCTEAI